jgi:plasmid stabilization system protein ParE
MSYRLKYRRRALNQLTDIWVRAADRNAVTAASSQLDFLLSTDPYAHGESRPKGRRIVVINPLIAYFKVVDAQRKVIVLRIRALPQRPPRP